MATVDRTTTISVAEGKGVDFSFAATGLWSALSGMLEFARLEATIWSRLLVLFVALAAMKLALLIQFGKRLVEVHWPLTPHEPVWGDYVLFGIFGLVSFASLLRLQRQCAVVGIQAVRAVNAIVLCVGLLLIFFTFHSRENNYLFPILTGVLNWDSLIPYLSLDLFFHPPFLGAWLFAYALSYYALARGGRESQVIYLTAIFASVYAVAALRELAIARTELLVVTALGAVSLMIRPRGDGKTRMVWWLAPLLWCAFFAVELFWFGVRQINAPVTYFWLFVYGTVLLFGGATLIAYRRGVGAAWSRVLLFYFAAFLLLSNRNYPGAANFNNVICLGLELPRYLLGEALVIGVLALVAAGYKWVFPQARFWWLDVVGVVLIAVAFVDLRLTQIMGARLGWDVLAMGGSAKMMWRMSRPYLPVALAGATTLAVLYAVTLKLVQAKFRGRPSGSGETSRSGLWYAASAFAFLGLLGIVTANPDKAEGQSGLRLIATSPIWRRATARTMKPEEFLNTARSLGMGELNATAPAPVAPRADLNVVLVFMESTYNKHLSLFGGTEETQPLLSKYRERMELYPNFFSSFASSIHARFAAFTSLYPVRDYNAFTLERVPVKSVFEVLHENGYACSLFYSSFLDYTGFRNFLHGRGLDGVYDADTMPGERKTERVAWGLREEETLGAMQRQIKEYASSGKRFFLTYVPAAPHYPYEKVPERFHKYKPGEMGDYTPLYYNELLYMDWVVASIVEQLEQLGLLDKTVVIITNDHGEMLGEQSGPIGHGFMLSPELVNTPLIVMDPRKPGYRINRVIGSQVDLLPTMLELLGMPIPNGELYQGKSLARAGEGKERLIYLNSMQEFGVIAGNRLMLGDRERDKGALTRAFTIESAGAKTIFNDEVGASSTPEVWIQRFDNFQENLLRNYSLYQKSVRNTGALSMQR